MSSCELWRIDSLGGDVETLTVRDNLTPDTNAVDVGTGAAPLGYNPKTRAEPFGQTTHPIEANVLGGYFRLAFDGKQTGNIFLRGCFLCRDPENGAKYMQKVNLSNF